IHRLLSSGAWIATRIGGWGRRAGERFRSRKRTERSVSGRKLRPLAGSPTRVGVTLRYWRPDRTLACDLSRPPGFAAVGRRRRQGEIEGGSPPQLALHPHSASVGLHDALDDRQPQPDPSQIPIVRLPEPAEDVRQLVGRNTSAA